MNIQKRKTKAILYQLFALIVGLFVILPVIYALMISFMPANEIMSRPPRFVPKRPTLRNYKQAVMSSNLPRFMWNSFVIATISSLVRIVTSAMAGYAFAFYHFKLKNPIFYLFMGSIMIPSDVVLVTNYHTVAHLGLINTYAGMVIIFLCSATHVFIMRQYFLTFSKEIREAAIIDGSSNLRFFVQILLPLSIPIITTVFISSFIGTWNTYLWPMLVTNDNLMRTVQVGVTMLNFPDGIVYGPVMAASILILLPTLIIFLVFESKIVSGIMGGAIKG